MTLRGSILLVDDEEKILKTLGRALRDAGLEVVESRLPRDAQRMLAESSFDVLLVDNVMPQLNGLDLIREYVASTPEGDRPQILMMTAHATVESAIEAMKLGAFDFITKPIQPEVVRLKTERALELCAARRGRRAPAARWHARSRGPPNLPREPRQPACLGRS